MAGRLLGLAVPALAGFCDPEDSAWRLVWRDEFDGPSLDESKWSVQEGVVPMERLGTAAARTAGPLGRRQHRCRGEECHLLGSCREAACTRDNVYVEDGSLVLRSQREKVSARNYSTGAVHTWDTAAWRAGDGTFRLCISAQLPGSGAGNGEAQGIWPAHWLMPRDNTCDPDEGEMDIMEMVNGDAKWEATYHWQTGFPSDNCSYPDGHQEQTTSAALPDFNTSFHEYAVERGPHHVAFVLDGVVRLNVTVGTTPEPVFWDAPWYLILNTAIGGGWPGSPNSSTVFPIYHKIDYVRVAQLRAMEEVSV